MRLNEKDIGFDNGQKIYLDDERLPPDFWTRDTTAQGVIDTLTIHNSFHYRDMNKGGDYRTMWCTHLSLDHDLGDEAIVGTGYDVLLWIEKKITNHMAEDKEPEFFFLPEIKIHTANVSARVKMEAALKKIKELYNQQNNGEIK